MDKRVYGIIGVSSIMANWNADFSGNPKTISTGQIFGSDKALKFTMKKQWEEEGEKVLYLKSYKLTDNNLQPRSLKERYEKIFSSELKSGKDEKNSTEVLENLFSAIDVKNFGATFAEGGNNISILGAVQIGQGMNLYKDATVHEQQILSPFRDSKVEDAGNSTLGTKIVTEEAHYFYPFAINPKAYNQYIELGVTEGYTEADYERFKKTCLQSVTSFASNSKSGADNEFNVFVETGYDFYLPKLTNYIIFKKGRMGEKNTIEFSGGSLLSGNEEIKSIEVYYNPESTIIEGFPENTVFYNVFTKERI